MVAVDRTAIMMRWLWILILSLVVLLVTWGWVWADVAIAAIRQLEETPGQVVFQSRQTLTDQHGMGWQAIAFKRIRPDGSSQLYLRLVGFPGTAAIDRTQPLSFRSSMGQTLTAVDASRQIFTNADSPEPNVGQYDLQPLLSQLQAEVPWRVSLPILAGSPLMLQIPPALIEEWHTLVNYS